MKLYTRKVGITRRPVKLRDPNRTYKKCPKHGECIHRLKPVNEAFARFRWFCERCGI